MNETLMSGDFRFVSSPIHLLYAPFRYITGKYTLYITCNV